MSGEAGDGSTHIVSPFDDISDKGVNMVMTILWVFLLPEMG